AFPSYDGNGMHYSMGNISLNPEIGILFIAFDRPYRLRMQGRGELVREGPILDMYPEADLAVRVAVSEVWINCPRYVHRYEKVKPSRYVPREGIETPLCEWKRIDGVQDVIRPEEVKRVEQVGQITADDWMERVLTGDENA